MRLITSRLHLRPVISSDADELFRIYGDPATNTFNPAGPYPDIDYARDVLARWIKHWKDSGFGNWAISLKDNPERIIGFGGLSIRIHADTAINNLGYRFSVESWGKGLATEFANHAVNYGFGELKLPEISALVRANHLASQKVLVNAGLRYVQDIHDVRNTPASMLFTLTYAEWNKKQE
ncbi:GNAT family N-acetyltransferase [Pantoea agglomerans]|uniref:GNAT family N-acetyltransferase n=1 Tax=Enterobacter agglomerans TaxID=549 RepID=UPI0023AEDD17|nr:GNAT family N-acetyltransferase [Pantoea agglomerans]WEC75316.1 GNAT family N-acetyltransferase [Pantoea agglomerans]WNK38095.1 GNAT family N-acetyltransferase [Pantoea agglomerans]WNK74232.1 GNAT family N-acetyltransferase [Pantoea agglomerans]